MSISEHTAHGSVTVLVNTCTALSGISAPLL